MELISLQRMYSLKQYGHFCLSNLPDKKQIAFSFGPRRHCNHEVIPESMTTVIPQ